MRHEMKLKAEPFYKIKSGLKTVELRLYDEKRQAIAVSDEILFTLADGDETLLCEVLSIHRFDSFAELYSALPLSSLGYTDAEIPEASPYDMERYYSREEMQKYGVCGIRIRVFE